jgi:hypothetical protein
MPDQFPSTENRGQVVRFRPRGTSPSSWRWPVHRVQPGEAPVEDLKKFERTDAEDDYGHRMRMNGLAVVIATVLIVSGVWLAVSIAEMVKNQDCFLQGRGNCNPPVPVAPER